MIRYVILRENKPFLQGKRMSIYTIQEQIQGRWIGWLASPLKNREKQTEIRSSQKPCEAKQPSSFLNHHVLRKM